MATAVPLATGGGGLGNVNEVNGNGNGSGSGSGSGRDALKEELQEPLLMAALLT
jgi:hypothetical protein